MGRRTAGTRISCSAVYLPLCQHMMNSIVWAVLLPCSCPKAGCQCSCSERFVSLQRRLLLTKPVPPLRADESCSCTIVGLFEQESVTLRNQINPRALAKLLNLNHLYDDLGDDIKEMVRSFGVPSFLQGVPRAAKNKYHGAREETQFSRIFR